MINARVKSDAVHGSTALEDLNKASKTNETWRRLRVIDFIGLIHRSAIKWFGVPVVRLDLRTMRGKQQMSGIYTIPRDKPIHFIPFNGLPSTPDERAA